MPITGNKGISTTAKTTEDDAGIIKPIAYCIVDLLLGNTTTAPKRKVKRAPILKEDDLLSPMGFNKLIRIVKKKKFKGTGHEVQDLESLLSIIQNWGHEIMEDEDFENEIQQHLESQKVKEIEIQEDKLAQIELNRQKAMAKLQLRQLEREAQRVEQERQEEEARVAAMIAEAGHLFMD
ncbi:hypothetical protein HDV02_002932 [Globomyces sp. JEL0801]|nr:hypothetical protein HDV02_002932 [Globomyces sp. JEL0801]